MQKYQEEGEDDQTRWKDTHRRDMETAVLSAEEMLDRAAWRKKITSDTNDPRYWEKSENFTGTIRVDYVRLDIGMVTSASFLCLRPAAGNFEEFLCHCHAVLRCGDHLNLLTTAN